MALSPHEFPELHEPNLLHLYAGIGLDSPEKIGAAPWGEAMALGGVPDKPDAVAHENIITTKGTKLHEGKGAGPHDDSWTSMIESNSA